MADLYSPCKALIIKKPRFTGEEEQEKQLTALQCSPRTTWSNGGETESRQQSDDITTVRPVGWKQQEETVLGEVVWFEAFCVLLYWRFLETFCYRVQARSAKTVIYSILGLFLLNRAAWCPLIYGCQRCQDSCPWELSALSEWAFALHTAWVWCQRVLTLNLQDPYIYKLHKYMSNDCEISPQTHSQTQDFSLSRGVRHRIKNCIKMCSDVWRRLLWFSLCTVVCASPPVFEFSECIKDGRLQELCLDIYLKIIIIYLWSIRWRWKLEPDIIYILIWTRRFHVVVSHVLLRRSSRSVFHHLCRLWLKAASQQWFCEYKTLWGFVTSSFSSSQGEIPGWYPNSSPRSPRLLCLSASQMFATSCCHFQICEFFIFFPFFQYPAVQDYFESQMTSTELIFSPWSSFQEFPFPNTEKSKHSWCQAALHLHHNSFHLAVIGRRRINCSKK